MASAEQKRLSLIRYKKQHCLTRQNLADEFGVSLITIHAYLRPQTSKASRIIPNEIYENTRPDKKVS